MTTFSHTTGYAIEALACLARNGAESMLVREIAELTDMPLPYLSKIFRRLADGGIVESKRGYKGGVKLSRPPGEISLLQIDAALESGRPGGHLDFKPIDELGCNVLGIGGAATVSEDQNFMTGSHTFGQHPSTPDNSIRTGSNGFFLDGDAFS